MDNLKISVLIPMYNRKQYAAQCIDSILNQTFQDFEIVIRDDCSNDGVFEFVREKYAAQISSGKIRMFRNSENIGEGRNMNRIFRDAKGKYVQVVHNDDMLMSDALQKLYDVAEEYHADVVHSAFILNSPSDGIINKDTKLTLLCMDAPPQIKEITLVSNNPLERFNEWINHRIFQDVQYNFFNLNFILENELPYDPYEAEATFFALWWIMLAKVLVKTPLICYIRRNSPHNLTNIKVNPYRHIEKFISAKIELSRDLNKLFKRVEFFRNNELLQYTVKAHLFTYRDDFEILRREIFSNGVTPEIYESVTNTFKRYFGDDYFYPAMLFNWCHVMPYRKRADVIFSPPPESR